MMAPLQILKLAKMLLFLGLRSLLVPSPFISIFWYALSLFLSFPLPMILGYLGDALRICCHCQSFPFLVPLTPFFHSWALV
jgi:hypothetical protein